MDIVKHNRDAWTKEVLSGDRWTIPVDSETIAKAKNDDWQLVLTPTIFVPRDWFSIIKNKKILCLAAGGGQQGPILSAAGADTIVFDNCPAQLEQDRFVALRDNLNIEFVQGDMRDLSCFENESFDLIFHPVSNCFVDRVDTVWQECFRILKPKGRLLAGFANPLIYIFDQTAWDNNELEVKYTIPYSDIAQLPDDELKKRIKNKDTLEFGHSLDTQIGGQIKAGFAIKGFYEDLAGGDLLDTYIKTFMATLAVK